MKQIYNYIALIALTLSFFTSCNTGMDNIVVDSPTEATASVLTAEGDVVIVPNDNNLNQISTIFNWTRTLLGDPVIPVTYTVLVDTTDQFQTARKISVGTNNISKGFFYKDINDWGLGFTKDASNPKPIDLFVKIAGSVYTQNTQLVVPTDTVYSNYLTLNVTPFLSEPAVIYLPGDYAENSWSPEKSPMLYSETRNNVYLGYVYLNKEFKITPAPNWDNSYGGANGVLEGSDNIKTTPGFYWMEADLNKMTYKLTPTVFSVIGSIKGDWGTDFVMAYDTKKNALSVTETFSTGEFKFRKDKKWDFAYGIGTDGNLTSENGGNIPLDLSGKVTITLNLWNYLEPTYSVAAAE